MRLPVLPFLLSVASIAFIAEGADTSTITSLTPEEAEKLICTDDKCHPVQRTQQYTVTKCRQEERTKDINGKSMTYTVMVPFTEEIIRSYTVMCRGGLLSLDSLAELSPATAQVLARHKGCLDLNGLKEISPEAAKALGSQQGSISLGGLETVTQEVAEALSEHTGRVECRGLKRVDVVTYETLRLKQALPSSVIVDRANMPTVLWRSMGPDTLANYRRLLGEQMGVRVILDKSIVEKYGLSLKQKLSPPPHKVMYQDEAIRWLATELSKEHPGAIVGIATATELIFKEAEKP